MDIKLSQFRQLFNTGDNGKKSETKVSSTEGTIQVNVGENDAVTLVNIGRHFSERHFSNAPANTNTEAINRELRTAFINALTREGADADFIASVTDLIVKDPTKPLSRRVVKDVLSQFDKFLESDSYRNVMRSARADFAAHGDVEKTGMRSGPMAAFVTQANDAISEDVTNGDDARIYFGFKANDPEAHFATEKAEANASYTLHRDVNHGVLSNVTGFVLKKLDQDFGKWLGHKIESGLGFRQLARAFNHREERQNNDARKLFMNAVLEELRARGLKGVTFDNMPESIKDALKLDDFAKGVKMNKNGTVKYDEMCGRPLTARRILAVRDAINALFSITQKADAKDKSAVIIGVLTGRIAPSSTSAMYDRTMRGGVKRTLEALRGYLVASSMVPVGQARPTIPEVRFGLNYVKFVEKADREGKMHLMATVGGITTEIEGGVNKLIANLEKDIRNHTEYYSLNRLMAEKARIESKPLEESRAERLEFYLSVIRSKLGEKDYKSLNLATASLAQLRQIADNALHGSYDKPAQRRRLAEFVSSFDPGKLKIASANAVEVVEQMEQAIANHEPPKVVMPPPAPVVRDADRLVAEERAAMHDLIADFIEPNDVVQQNRELAHAPDPGVKFVDTLLTHFDGFKALLRADNNKLRNSFAFAGEGLPEAARNALADKVVAAMSSLKRGNAANLAFLTDNLLRTALEYLSVVMRSGVGSPEAVAMRAGINNALKIDEVRARQNEDLARARANIAELENRVANSKGFMKTVNEGLLSAARLTLSGLERNMTLMLADLLADDGAMNEIRDQIIANARDLQAQLNEGLNEVASQVSPRMASLVQEVFHIPYREMVELLRLPNETQADAEERTRRLIGEPPREEQHENAAPAAEKPAWQRSLADLNGEQAINYRNGEGRFMIKSLLLYLESLPENDRRHMVASLVRYTRGGDSAGAVIGAMLKGAGPIMQKMLQGIPLDDSIPADLKIALVDMRDNLAPIPASIVEAQLYNIVKESNGEIESIQLNNTMGAASVGQSFLATIVKKDHTTAEVVVKLLRPDVQNRANREKDFFRGIAAMVPGMKHTFEGRLSTILDELDLTIEATNIEQGIVYHENPDFNVKSVKVSSLVKPKTDVLVMERAPGDTIQTRMNIMRGRLATLKSGDYVSRDSNKARCYRAHSHEEYFAIRREMLKYLKENSNHNRLLTSLATEWITEAVFNGGFFHGDMHAGNIMSDGKTMTVIDFGNATKLTTAEQESLIKIVVSTTAQRADRFLEGFRGLLSDDGKRVFDRHVDELAPRVAQILKMGHSSDAGSRILAVMNLMQQREIEVPAQVSKFVQSMMRLTEAIAQTEAIDREITGFLQNFTIDDGREIIEEGGQLIRQHRHETMVDDMRADRLLESHLSDVSSTAVIDNLIRITDRTRHDLSRHLRDMTSVRPTEVREKSPTSDTTDILNYVTARGAEVDAQLVDDLRQSHHALVEAYEACRARMIAAHLVGGNDDLHIVHYQVREQMSAKSIMIDRVRNRIAENRAEAGDAELLTQLEREKAEIETRFNAMAAELEPLQRYYLDFAEKAERIYAIDCDKVIADLESAKKTGIPDPVGFDQVFGEAAVSNVKSGLAKLGFFTALGLNRSQKRATEEEEAHANKREEIFEKLLRNPDDHYDENRVQSFLPPEVKLAIDRAAINFAFPPEFKRIVADPAWVGNEESVRTVLEVLAHNAKILREHLMEGKIPAENFLADLGVQRTAWTQLLIWLIDSTKVPGLAHFLGAAKPENDDVDPPIPAEQSVLTAANRAELARRIDAMNNLAEDPAEAQAIKNMMKEFFKATERYYAEGGEDGGALFELTFDVQPEAIEERPVVQVQNLERPVVEERPVVQVQNLERPIIEERPVVQVYKAEKPIENDDAFDIAYYRGKLAEMEQKFPVVKNYATRQEFANLQGHMDRAKFVLNILEHELGKVVVKNTYDKIKTDYVVNMLKPDDYDTDEELKAVSVDLGNGKIAVAYTAHRAGRVLERLAQAPNHYAEFNAVENDPQARLHFLTYAGGLLERYVMSVVDPFSDTFGTERFKNALGVYSAPIKGKCIENNTNAIEAERTERGLMRIGGKNGEAVVMNFADTTEKDELYKCIDLEVGFIVRNREASGEHWSELAPILAKRLVGLTRMVNGVPTKVTVADIEDCRNKYMAQLVFGDEEAQKEEDLDDEVQLNIADYTRRAGAALEAAKAEQAKIREAHKAEAEDEDELLLEERTPYDGAVEKLENAKKALEFLAKIGESIVKNPEAFDEKGKRIHDKPAYLRVAHYKTRTAQVPLTRKDFASLLSRHGIKVDMNAIRYRESSPCFASQCLRYAENLIKNYAKTVISTYEDGIKGEKKDFTLEEMGYDYINSEAEIAALERVHTGPAFLEKKIFEAAFGQRPTQVEIAMDERVLDNYERAAEVGKVEKTADSFEYKGIVFRADARSFKIVREHGKASGQKVDGFSSQKDLADPENLKEAKGVGKALGATGQSGVSCSRVVEKCIGYATAPMGNSFSYIYVIDTTKLAEGDHAWDMDSVYDAGGGANPEKTGREVNASAIRKEAVMGWIKVPREVADYEGADPEFTKTALLRRYCLEHPTAIEANPAYVG